MPSSPQPTLSARGRWLTLIAALLGGMVDGLEMSLFPLVARPALGDLLGTTDRVEISRWVSVITAGFLIGAATGGVLFGWLGDRIGRVRAMTLSVLTYAVFSGLCGLAGEAWQVAVLRFIASLGMGGEWSLGVALVMEVWPDRSRAWLAAAIGAAANFGYMIIAVAGLALSVSITDLRAAMLSVGVGPETSDWLVRHSGWRILMLCGALPALLTFLIRLFVPESTRWEAEKRKGSTAHWQTVDLLGVLIGAGAGCGLTRCGRSRHRMVVRATGSIAMIVLITAGYLYPIVRYVRRAEASTETRLMRPTAGGQRGSAAGLPAPVALRECRPPPIGSRPSWRCWNVGISQAPTWADELSMTRQRLLSVP